MSSKAARHRRKMKEENPEKYALCLERSRLRSKERRDILKKKWEEESHTQAEIEVHEQKKREKRERETARYHRKKAEQMRQTRKYSPATPKTPKKRPKDMTDAERRRYNADMRKKQRDARSSQKKTFDRIKRRRQWQLKKQEELQKMISNKDRKKFTKHLKKACNLNNEIKPSTKELNLTSQQYVETVPIYLTIPNSKTSEKKLANAHLQGQVNIPVE